MIIPLDSSTVNGLTLEGAALRKRRKSEEAMLDVTGMSADAQLQLNSKDCGIKMSQGYLETTVSVLTAHWSWEQGQCEGDSPGTEQSEVELPSLVPAARVGLENWQIHEINGLQDKTSMWKLF